MHFLNTRNISLYVLCLWAYLIQVEIDNNALAVNSNTVGGRTADIKITTHGSDWYWAACAVITTTALAIFADSFSKPVSHRISHYITAGINLVAAIAYFNMASNLGWAPIQVEFVRSSHLASDMSLEIFYVRYIDR